MPKPDPVGAEIRVTSQGVLVPAPFSSLVSLDVRFNHRRIWSFSLQQGEAGTYKWPSRLSERLSGFAEVEVIDSATGELFARDRVAFDDSPTAFEFVDSAGRPLMLNKWLRPVPALADGAEHDLRSDLVEMLVRVRSALEGLDLQVFAVGGTLLGPHRDGDLIAHDDDGDLAVYLGELHPFSVARRMMQLASELEGLGFRVRTHSHAHLQVYPAQDDVRIDSKLYIDVFAAYHEGDVLNQPFHVRGALGKDQFLPFQSIEIRGERFNAPADLDAWLTLNYDENWSVPQPGFQIETPVPTARRFNSLFGSFNVHRHFWELLMSDLHSAGDYERVTPGPAPARLPSRVILNLGCGPRPWLPDSLMLEDSSPVIHALDFADAVREAAERERIGRSEPSSRIVVEELNFANYNAVLRFVATLPAEPFDLYSGFTIESQDPTRRDPGFWRLARMSLLSGGAVVMDVLHTPGSQLSVDDPRTWHLEAEAVIREAGAHGLEATPTGDGRVYVAGEIRNYTRWKVERAARPARVTLAPVREGGPMQLVRQLWSKLVPKRVRQWISDRRHGAAAAPERDLAAEIDELRADQRRVAELMDAVERLTLERRDPK